MFSAARVFVSATCWSIGCGRVEGEVVTMGQFAALPDNGITPAFLRRASPRRRHLLQTVGSAVTYGLVSPLLVAEDQAKRRAPAIKACVFIFYYGGPSHLETWDPKPAAPSTVRGEFRPIPTTVPGLQIGEHLPHMSQVMHHCAVIRSMHHSNRLHDSASIETHTGRQAAQGDREEFAPIPQFFPCHGAVLSHLGQPAAPVVAHAALPFMFHNVVDVPCQGGGFLGASLDPFRISVNPQGQNYTAEELQQREGMTGSRVSRRARLLTELQSTVRGSFGATSGLDAFYQRAFQLLDSGKIAAALDVSSESPACRERYGLYPEPQGTGNGAYNAFARHMRGQNLLAARRLVEAGVSFVNVYDFRQQGQNWDSHSDNFGQHRNILLPPADRALAALISDLEERGLLDSTLIVAAGEFGRTPVINRDAGRDHWPDCYSVLLAGGGVEGGAIYGASDAQGAYPALDPVTPADLAATIYDRFGYDPVTHIHDRTSRPWHISEGRPIQKLFRV